jgi:hypothetical protein
MYCTEIVTAPEYRSRTGSSDTGELKSATVFARSAQAGAPGTFV